MKKRYFRLMWREGDGPAMVGSDWLEESAKGALEARVKQLEEAWAPGMGYWVEEWEGKGEPPMDQRPGRAQ